MDKLKNIRPPSVCTYVLTLFFYDTYVGHVFNILYDCEDHVSTMSDDDTISLMKNQLLAEHPNVLEDDLKPYFQETHFLDMVQKCSGHNDFIKKLEVFQSVDKSFFTKLRGMDSKTQENIFIKLRAIALTQKLLSAVPSNVRKSVDQMTQNLTKSPSISGKTPTNTPIKSSSKTPIGPPSGQPQENKTQALELMNKMLDSPLFNNLQELIEDDDGENINDVRNNMEVLERRVTLLEAQMRKLKSRRKGE